MVLETGGVALNLFATAEDIKLGSANLFHYINEISHGHAIRPLTLVDSFVSSALLDD